jgi:putative peptidoglycan lipid II flippase
VTARTSHRLAAGLAGAAVLIGVATALARVAGFARQVVFNGTVGQTALGTAYATANTVPNIIFEIVAGGALASLVVPVLAGAVGKGDGETAGRTASALLTWVAAVLTPCAVVAALAAEPLMRLLLQDKAADEAMLAVSSRMLLVFLPQIVLYGIAVVAGGILQAHRRFLAASLAPLVSSIVVAGAYLVFAAGFSGDPNEVGSLDRRSELTLSVGTTLGVLALCLCMVVPLAGTGLRLRPTFSFPAGVAGRVRGLALAGFATLAAQQASVVVVLMLANARAGLGAVVTYQTAWMIYLLPWAVLAVPIATSAFPLLSRHAHDGDGAAFAGTTARTTRAVVLVTCAGAAVLAAAALPVGRFFAVIGPAGVAPIEMTRALVAFAPGLVGYGLVAHLGRALYAHGRGRAAAVATVAGWLGVLAADVALVLAAPGGWVIAALAAGNTVGMTLAGLLLVRETRRAAGPDSVRGAGRVLVGGLAGAVAGGVAGWAVAAWALAAVPGPVGTIATVAVPVAVAAAAAAVAAVVFAAPVLLFAGADLRMVLNRRFGRG